jgi:hypothetical protein
MERIRRTAVSMRMRFMVTDSSRCPLDRWPGDCRGRERGWVDTLRLLKSPLTPLCERGEPDGSTLALCADPMRRLCQTWGRQGQRGLLSTEKANGTGELKVIPGASRSSCPPGRFQNEKGGLVRRCHNWSKDFPIA